VCVRECVCVCVYVRGSALLRMYARVYVSVCVVCSCVCVFVSYVVKRNINSLNSIMILFFVMEP
jgi:hypothetical protein